VDGGKYVQTMKTPNRKPVLEYLKLQGRFKHLKESDVADIQKMVDTRYAELEKRFSEK
jgi:pyruvate/2-oxoacid:ferredoxin oxidoreductase beta subunit